MVQITPAPMKHPVPLPNAISAMRRCLVMGVLNVTPDSFSDGGRWDTADRAVPRGLELAATGADIVDVGGESTRPGAARVTVAEDLDRVLPVVAALAAAGLVVSVDTTRAEVARAAVEHGAVIVNDVSAPGEADPQMASVVADTGVVYVAMHSRGTSDVMDGRDVYDDVVRDVTRELAARVEVLLAAGIRPEQLVLDPGLGFAKAGANNWPLLARLDELRSLGYPVLVGASRKRFLGAVLADGGAPVAADRRDGATAAVTALAAAAGAWCVRVHDVAGSADAVRVAAAWSAATQKGAE